MFEKETKRLTSSSSLSKSPLDSIPILIAPFSFLSGFPLSCVVLHDEIGVEDDNFLID